MTARLMDVLVQKNLVSQAQADAAMKSAVTAGRDAVEQLIASGELDENKLVEFYSAHFSLPSIKLTNINAQALKLVAADTIRSRKILPFQIEADGTVRIAIADPGAIAQVEIVKSQLNRPVVAVFTTYSTLDAAINHVLEKTKTVSVQGPAAPSRQVTSTSIRAQVPPATAAPVYRSKVKRFSAQDQVVTIINQILSEAVVRGASDIHIEPQAAHVAVRFRYEGALFDVFEIPNELRDQIVNRVKVMSNLDISERRLPQDGRARAKIGEGEVGFRLSVMPAFYGESVVFRILRQSDLQLDIAKLGFESEQFEAFKKGIEAPNGMMLVTGPTGSGKTTTLYSALAALNERTVKISTVEDPVEYSLAGISQVQINKETGLDFAEVLKSLLRQDPDIILVGEVRDHETAAIAVQAALTGHLVLSSLHTNDAASAVVRLLNMKVEPFAVLAAINVVVAQRLIRRICQVCKEPAPVTEEQLKWLGSDRALIEKSSLFRGRGCDKCLGGGYRGRIAIFEVLQLDDAIKELFLKGENLINVKRYAISRGMRTLRQSALAHVAAGSTTLQEAIASTLEN